MAIQTMGDVFRTQMMSLPSIRGLLPTRLSRMAASSLTGKLHVSSEDLNSITTTVMYSDTQTGNNLLLYFVLTRTGVLFAYNINGVLLKQMELVSAEYVDHRTLELTKHPFILNSLKYRNQTFRNINRFHMYNAPHGMFSEKEDEECQYSLFQIPIFFFRLLCANWDRLRRSANVRRWCDT